MEIVYYIVIMASFIINVTWAILVKKDSIKNPECFESGEKNTLELSSENVVSFQDRIMLMKTKEMLQRRLKIDQPVADSNESMRRAAELVRWTRDVNEVLKEKKIN